MNGIIAVVSYCSGYKEIKIVKKGTFFNLEHYEMKLDKDEKEVMVLKEINYKSFCNKKDMMEYLAIECIEE